MTFRPPAVVAVAAIALATLVAWAIQLGLLGALGSSGPVQSGAELALTAAANTRVVTVGGNPALRFDPTRAPALAQAQGLNLSAGNLLAVILHSEEVTSNLRLTFGWLTTLDLRRPATATALLTASADPQQSVLLLAGHPRWRERITQVALAVENTNTADVPASANLTRSEWLPANPVGGTRLLATAWFQRDGNIITANESANRLLPLALWIALICATSVAAVALAFRKQPERRAESLRTCGALLAAGAILLTVLANRWPGWTVPLGGGVAAALALLLIDRTLALPLTRSQRASLALLAAGVAVLLAPLVAAVAVIPGVLLWLAQWQEQRQPERRLRVVAPASLISALIPALLLAAIAQGMIAAPSLLSPLVDPTKTLATVATSAGGLPGLALGLLAMHQLWPAPALCQRWASGAAAATVWALIGAVAVLAIPKIAVLANGGSTYTALFLPMLACLALALLPKFQMVARSIEETVVVDAKSEQDLSVQALALLEGHAERVQATLGRREMGAAHAALVQMQRIAPAAHATALARLRIALSEGDLGTATKAATQVAMRAALTTADHDALLELAHRANQQPRVIELAAGATRNEGNLRALALAQLLTDGPAPALQTLATWPNEDTFAREIAELNLLTDNVGGTQLALVNTGIALTDPVGQAYVARLGLRVQGPKAQADGINSLAVWHPQLGAVHAAQAELLLRQGNAAGARARFLLAVKLDPMLWPLQYQLQRLDAASAAATSVQENLNSTSA